MFKIFSLLIFLYIIYKWFQTKYQYWKKRGIKYVEPLPIIGNYKTVLLVQQRIADLWYDIYNNNKDEQLVGLYEGINPVLLLRDPELIKHVLIKDFSHFINRVRANKRTYLDANLLHVEMDRWRIIRPKLSALFTVSKLKNMVPLIEHCIDRLLNHLDDLVKSNTNQELRTLVNKYSLEVFCSCIFGVEVDAINDNAQLFEEIGKLIFKAPTSVKVWTGIDLLMPKLLDVLSKFKYHPNVDKRVLEFFMNLSDKLIKEREGKPKLRHDLIDLMVELKEQDKLTRKDDDKTVDLDIDKGIIAAQSFAFYAGGYETTASTIAFLLYELAINEELQNRVYKEIVTVSNNYGGEIVYESLIDLQYLSMCIDETLRKYPIVSRLHRICVENYILPGTNVSIEKGTKIAIPTLGLHHDSKYFPNPRVFDPERFSPDNKNKIPSCVYLPFGDGPRNCIGTRFAKVSSMLMLANFLKRFKVTPMEEAPPSSEIKFSKRNLTLASEGGLMVYITRR